jgi:hypothetical protein
MKALLFKKWPWTESHVREQFRILIVAANKRTDSLNLRFSIWMLNYRVFHGFGQAKFADGGSIFGLSKLSLLSELPLKTTLDLFKRVQN